MRLDKLLKGTKVTQTRYQQLQRKTASYKILYDHKDDEWDFSPLDKMDKTEAALWISDSRTIKQYQKENNMHPFFYSVMIIKIVYSKEDTDKELEWPEHLQSYDVANVAEAYLIDKHELYEMA